MQEQLETVTVGVAPVLAELLEPLRQHLETEKMIAYGLQTDAERVLGLSFLSSSSPLRPSAQERFSAYIAETPNFGNFDALCPQIEQRNRLVTWTREKVAEVELPFIRDVYPEIEIHQRAQTRALVCKGDTLLAYVGAWQPDPFDPEQLRRFRQVLPLLQPRLALESAANDAMPSSTFSPTLLDAALEAIARPVLIVSAEGRVREANCLAVGLVASRREEISAGIVGLLRGDPPVGWSVTRVEQRGGGLDFLVLLPVTPMRADGTVFRALARSWELTARQADVLALLCEGRTNQSIAAVLDISPRTVEVHVAALFDKAKVSARSELLAKVLSLV